MAKPDHRDPDVDSALDLIVGDTPLPAAVPISRLRETAKEKGSERIESQSDGLRRNTETSPPSIRNTRGSASRPKARTGRPPGVQSAPRKLKDKTSLALDLELMDRYRKQSWKEECQLGELVERALREYAARTWDWKWKS